MAFQGVDRRLSVNKQKRTAAWRTVLLLNDGFHLSGGMGFGGFHRGAEPVSALTAISAMQTPLLRSLMIDHLLHRHILLLIGTVSFYHAFYFHRGDPPFLW